ncbi:Protein TolB [bioreactor metagenome]|uniref:Protein TolB n=1 Tax=bioreactor metagenome TaxID=1076179 RepID=A0A644WN69_9ZZZZ
MIKKLYILFVALFLSGAASAQYYMLGEDAANQKWYSIETEHFTFVFPETFLDRAQTLANQSEQYYGTVTGSLNHVSRKIPVLIHTGSVVANAYSLWTPERTEYFMTPSQNNYAHNWLQQLIIHEDRHMVQMDKLNQGLTKALGYIVGEQSVAVTLGLFMPMWYMEGDAVTTETAFSESGRGRIPSFEMKMKAQLLTEGLYNFEKASLGSYKDFVPDQYYFGYYYVAQSRKYYGASLWDNAIRNSARNWWQISPISHSFKKQTGYSKKELYRIFFRDLKDQWLLQTAAKQTAKYTLVPLPESKVQTHYKFPEFINDSTILAEKSGMDDYARFVTININTGEEKTICKAGFYASEELPATDVIPVLSKNSPGSWTTDNLSLAGNCFVWAEKKWHPRWEHVSYSVIMKHDLSSGKTTQLTHRTKYFSPALSTDGKRIVAVEFLPDGTCNIVVLDASDGNLIDTYPIEKGSFAMTPEFSPDAKQIVCITQKPDLKGIEILDIDTRKWHTVLAPSANDISNPSWKNDGIYFNAPFSGTDNVYHLDPASCAVSQITFDTFGAFNIAFSPSGERFVFSSYQNAGFVLQTAKTNEIAPLEIQSVCRNCIGLDSCYIGQEKPFLPDSLWKDSLYEIKKYRKGLHLFNLHSWMPVSFNSDNYSLLPGVSFSSQNLLSTSVLTGGYEYLTNEETGRFYADYTYTGWYPEITLKGSFGTRHGLADLEGYTDFHTWMEQSAGIELCLPLKSTIRDFFQKYRLTAGFNIHNIDPYVTPSVSYITNLPNGNMFSVESKFEFMNRQKTVLRDLMPRWGQDLDIIYKQSISGDVDAGSQLTASAKLFFPGFANHHGFKLDAAYMKKQAGEYSFTDDFIYPRGYTQIASTESEKIGLNYKFPVWYPDFNIGSLLYFKRLKLNLFYDYGEYTFQNSRHIMNSTGCEWTCDTHVFRFFIPLDIGFRYAYLPRTNENTFEFLLGINFSGF